jgi:hypothetical protein
MTQEPTMVPLVGSTREPLPGARVGGELAADTMVQVTVYLRPRGGVAGVRGRADPVAGRAGGSPRR